MMKKMKNPSCKYSYTSTNIIMNLVVIYSRLYLIPILLLFNNNKNINNNNLFTEISNIVVR